MCTVSALIKKLQELPQETVINVLKIDSSGWNNTCVWEELDINEFSENFDYINLKENPFANEKQKKMLPSLDLGCT
jgi:hypothetical protein